MLEGREGEEYEEKTGVPQGSPVAPILFTAYLSGIFDHVEEACPGVQGLSIVDDVAWWAEGKSEKETAEALGRAAEATLEWAENNGITFDHAKTEAMFLSKRRRKPTESVRVALGYKECGTPAFLMRLRLIKSPNCVRRIYCAASFH